MSVQSMSPKGALQFVRPVPEEISFEGFGMRVKDHRQARGFTQSQLGEMVGISATTVCYIETDKSICALEVAIRLSKVFGVSLEYLINGEEEFSPEARAVARNFDAQLEFVRQQASEEAKRLAQQASEDSKKLAQLRSIIGKDLG